MSLPTPAPDMEEAIEAARRIVFWVDLSGEGPADAWPTTCGDAIKMARALLSLKEEWRPISEAPKDGTDIDVWISNPDPVVGSLRMPDASWREGKWQSYGEKFGWMPIEKFGARVTHFRPLPSPPKD